MVSKILEKPICANLDLEEKYSVLACINKRNHLRRISFLLGCPRHGVLAPWLYSCYLVTRTSERNRRSNSGNYSQSRKNMSNQGHGIDCRSILQLSWRSRNVNTRNEIALLRCENVKKKNITKKNKNAQLYSQAAYSHNVLGVGLNKTRFIANSVVQFREVD